MKRIITIILILLVSFIITGCNKNEDNNKISIIATNYPSYEFARAVVNNNSNIEVKMLLKPGSEPHTYEPTPKDIKLIENSKMFIYVGGESDTWVDDILSSIDTSDKKIVRLIDLVETKSEELKEGMDSVEEEDEEDEIDEHVWTSPINAIKIVRKLNEYIDELSIKDKEELDSNASNYINELESIDKEIRSVISSSKRKEIIIGDRFPLRYFADEYSLDYYAAFPGCSEQTEASSKTLSFLINKVKEDNIPVILKMELSNSNIANTIASETNTKVLEFNSAHNIKESDFNKGITYIDIMKENIKVLKEALN